MIIKFLRIAALFLLLWFAPGIANSQTTAEYHKRADLLLENYLTKYWDGNYIRNTGEWTYIHGMQAVIDGAARTHCLKYYGLIETFYEAQNSRRWLNEYYDDENWFVLTLIDAYDVTGEKKYLQKAKEIFADIQNTAWDTTCCGEVKGGLWWNKPRTQKATAINAGAVISAVKLFYRTFDPKYRKFAKQVYDFWWTNMVNKETYQVCDHSNPDGSKTWWKFTYNEGLMIGASVAMFKAYGKPSYLTNAHNIAKFMVENETVTNSFGKVLFDGSATNCGGDCQQFKGPGYRYLMELYQLDRSKKVYYDVLKASVNSLWNFATADHSVSTDWSGPAVEGLFNDRTQNAAAQAMSLFASESGLYPNFTLFPNQYEAENATIKGILLENNQTGFDGWGFVGGWLGEGKYVKFEVFNLFGGNKEVTLKYAGAAGDAVRDIKVNNDSTINLVFPGTNAWNEFSEVTFTHYFPPGFSTIQVDYNANWLNLDYLRVESSNTGNLPASQHSVIVYPTVVTKEEQVQVRFSSANSTEVNLKIFDLFSQQVGENQYSVKEGQNELSLPVSNLKGGTYLLYFTKDGSTITKKITVNK